MKPSSIMMLFLCEVVLIITFSGATWADNATKGYSTDDNYTRVATDEPDFLETLKALKDTKELPESIQAFEVRKYEFEEKEPFALPSWNVHRYKFDYFPAPTSTASDKPQAIKPIECQATIEKRQLMTHIPIPPLIKYRVIDKPVCS